MLVVLGSRRRMGTEATPIAGRHHPRELVEYTAPLIEQVRGAALRPVRHIQFWIRHGPFRCIGLQAGTDKASASAWLTAVCREPRGKQPATGARDQCRVVIVLVEG